MKLWVEFHQEDKSCSQSIAVAMVVEFDDANKLAETILTDREESVSSGWIREKHVISVERSHGMWEAVGFGFDKLKLRSQI